MKQSLLKNKQQAGRFAIIGIINTAIDFSLLFGLKFLGLPVIPANFISSTTAFVFSFAANRSYTFKRSQSKLARQIVLFVAVTLFGLWVIQNVIIHFSEPILSAAFNSSEIGLLAAKICATIISLIWNYVLYATVVFPHKPSDV